MKPRDKKITVLYVDEAVAFGGSLTVIGYLVNAIDKDQFSAVVVGEVEVDMLKSYIRMMRIFIEFPVCITTYNGKRPKISSIEFQYAF